jgi:GNAT superfamily N-acetyltransferase
MLMCIREAKPEDAWAAAFLIQLAIQDLAEALTGETEELAILDELSYLFRHKGNRLSYQNSLIIEADGDVAGLIIAYHGSEAEELDKPIEERLRNKAKKHIPIEKEAKLGDYYIDTLCVKPAYWGKRIGTMLVEAIEQKAMKNNFHSIV